MSIFSDVLEGVAPWISAALQGGPVGIAIQAASTVAKALGSADSSLSGVKKILDNVTLSPEQQLALHNADTDFQIKMKQLGYADIEQLKKYDLDQITTVNASLIQELQNADKESWYQKAWRPACGFAVAAGSFVGVISFGYLAYEAIIVHDANALGALPNLATSLAMLLGVPGAAVGITAWHQGAGEREAAASK